MKKLSVLVLCCLLLAGGSTVKAQINPTPQELTVVSEERVQLPAAYSVSLDERYEQSPAGRRLRALLPAGTDKADFKIVAGVRGDKSVRRYAKKTPERTEGYYLRADRDGIVVVGADERGLLYGVETLEQLLEGGSFQPVEITDYPDVPFRGVVEGFYGTPWSHEARLRQIEFYGRNKMNVYLYGPKDDPYHSVPNWRKPYPEKEAEQIRQLVKHANDNGVLFYWAIHPGADIKWNDTDRNLLLQKFESMYALGVRAFALFFDDISGEGTSAERQAELLNFLDENFVQKKKDVAPLVFCPTIYNKAWSAPNNPYLTTLGSQLSKNVMVMWTGNSVVHCIDKASMEWINERIQRKAYIWWNYPVTDYCRDYLPMGPVYGNGLDIKDDLSGFVSNPMEHAEASKVALYSIADYVWNMDAYDSEASWARSLRNLLPGCSEELATFAAHSSDLGVNGHGFRRDESVALQPYLAALLRPGTLDEQAAAAVARECSRLEMAADVLLADKENPALITEMRPWLRQARLVGEYGQTVIGLSLCIANGNSSDFMPLYRHAHALQRLMYENEVAPDLHAQQPGVKVGTLHLLPTLNKLYTRAAQEYNRREQASLDTVAVYTPYGLESDVPQLRQQPVRWKGNTVNVAPSNEVVTWPSGASLTVTMEKARTLAGLSFNLGTKQISASFKLEASADGGDWQPIELVQRADRDVINTTNAINGMKADRIRLTNVSGKELKVYFRNFQFTVAH